MRVLGRLNSILNLSLSARTDALSLAKQYSVYPPYYLKPVFRKDEIEKLYESGEAEKIACMPIKAAESNHTCSVFYDEEITKFINYVTRKGKKALARDLVTEAFENIKRIQIAKYHKATDEDVRSKIIINPNEIFHSAMSNATPLMELIRVIRGGAGYQVPTPITGKRARFLAMNWLIEAAQDKEKTIHFPDKLAHELLDAAANTGRVVKKKQELHKQCEANKAYAHYRW